MAITFFSCFHQRSSETSAEYSQEREDFATDASLSSTSDVSLDSEENIQSAIIASFESNR